MPYKAAVRRRTRYLKIYPQYAPARGKGQLSCPCKFGAWCKELIQDGWVLCEAPDHKMLKTGRWTKDDWFVISTEACYAIWEAEK